MEQSDSSKRKRDVSSEWLHALVESALDGIVIMDDKGRIIAFNPAAEKIFGYRSEDVIGHPVADKLIPEPQRESHKKGLARFLATGKERIIGRRIEVVAMRADQSLFIAEMEVISVNPAAEPVFVTYIRDISEQKQAEAERRQYIINIRKTLAQTIFAVSRTVEIRDPYTAGHQRRVAHLAATIAQKLKLSDECIEGVCFGALIHDIGKIAVPSEIMSRPGKLLDEDVRYLQLHCRKGYEILEPVNFPWPVAEIALQHHEHLDGSGYPQGLKGGEILLESRIVCVADVVDALTAHRPYHPAQPLEEALGLILGKAAKWYDARIVSTCLELFDRGYRIGTIDIDDLPWISPLSL